MIGTMNSPSQSFEYLNLRVEIDYAFFPCQLNTDVILKECKKNEFRRW